MEKTTRQLPVQYESTDPIHCRMLKFPIFKNRISSDDKPRTLTKPNR